MDNQPSFDRALLIPILIGGFSIVGILVILLIGRSQNPPAEVPMTPSVTPFQYLYLGTEPSDATESPGATELPAATEAPTEIPLPFDSPTPVNLNTPGQSVSTPLLFPSLIATNTSPSTVLGTAIRSRTPTLTSTSGTAVATNTIDDTDTRLTYAPENSWVSQTNVSGAYQGTLHRSDTTGDSVTFTFAGPEIHIFYQAGPSLGSITITIDSLGGLPVSQALSQTQIAEWVDNDLGAGLHDILITHTGGGSVNIDSIVVPGPTPTPTRTPTP